MIKGRTSTCTSCNVRLKNKLYNPPIFFDGHDHSGKCSSCSDKLVVRYEYQCSQSKTTG